MQNRRGDPPKQVHSGILIFLAALTLLLCDEKNTAADGDGGVSSSAQDPVACKSNRLKPMPVFDLRDPVWAVPTSRADCCLLGVPRRVDFMGFRLTNVDGNTKRTPEKSSIGFVEFDICSRVTAKGTWEDGAITEIDVVYGNDGEPTELHVVRNQKELGEGIVFRFTEQQRLYFIESVGATSGTSLGEEIQEFDEQERLVSCIVARGNTRVRYVYKYEDTNWPSAILSFDQGSASQDGIAEQMTDVWQYQYDRKGRVTNWRTSRYFGSTILERSVQFTYDKNGNVVGATYGEGKDARSTRFEYRFDEKGNWVNRRELPVGGLKTDKDRGYEIERTITYWE